jgi:beta-glucosidase/6-phospho-beta-glucosidase/beta-galactosidase
MKWIDTRYSTQEEKAIIYIFENGVSVPNETTIPIADAIKDTFRVNYYKGYIHNVIDAVT